MPTWPRISPRSRPPCRRRWPARICATARTTTKVPAAPATAGAPRATPRCSRLASPGNTAYLKRQYLNFRQGLRGAHPEDKYGRQMKMMSAALPAAKDLDDVLGFIAAQGAAE
ncbi:MAG: hypothetical protein IPF57_22830 [Gammaproteobacteria bacterium]|nr:hypothetical protein [Gammaproteobacteria bacterium]